MHFVFFGLKRAHHSVLRVGRDALASFGLTAARFDLLFALSTEARGRMRQRALQQTLGVCRATVSRMLRSLEELGLVTRTVSDRDRRRKIVELTREGRARVARVVWKLVRGGRARIALYFALGKEAPSACWAAAVALQQTLLDIRHAFGDQASLDDDYVEAGIGYRE
jgi:DNA-binding MarR family transcriptional regulator